jgi:hypothetical protein
MAIKQTNVAFTQSIKSDSIDTDEGKETEEEYEKEKGEISPFDR